jgi:hypothetical protein
MRRFHRHVGFKGSFLVAFALVDFVYAVWLLTGPPSGTSRWFDAVVAIHFWATAWAAVGGICLFYAFRRPNLRGFYAAMSIKVVWGLGCLFGWALADVPISSVGIWGFFAWAVWRIAGAPVTEIDDEDGPHEP